MLKTTARYPVFRARPVLLDRRHITVCVNVTGTGTVPEFAYRIGDIRIFVLLVRARLVVARVTAGTIRFECRILPNNDFRVTLVALGALQLASMILRLVRQGGMTIVRGLPRVGVVAGVALQRSVEVIRVLADRCYAIVAGRTGAEYLRMIDGQLWRKHICGVAVFTHIGRQNMCRVFADCIRAVVAAKTVACDVYVIKIRR